jgi:hypothetical protein
VGQNVREGYQESTRAAKHKGIRKTKCGVFFLVFLGEPETSD